MPKPTNKIFSKQDKLRILQAADACSSSSEVNALLRSEGIYYSYLTRWRKTLQQKGESGLSSPRGRTPAPSNAAKLGRLERENARLQRELATAKEVIALQKKVSMLLQQLGLSEGIS
jgi:transposase